MSGSFRRGLVALTLAGLAARLLFLILEPATGPVGDERMWTVWGAEVIPSAKVAFNPRGFRFIFHPPVYPYFIAVLYALFGTLTAVKVAQCLLGALLVPAVGRIGLRAFGERPALVAAASAWPERSRKVVRIVVCVLILLGGVNNARQFVRSADAANALAAQRVGR